MAHSYYFFIASLPHLFLDRPPPFPLDAFLAACREQVRAEDFPTIQGILAAEIPPMFLPMPLIARWWEWEGDLRNALVQLRAVRRGVPPEEFLRASSSQHNVAKLAESLFQEPSPLVAENRYDQVRWDYLEALEFQHYFDLEKILIYALKLKILTRKTGFNLTQGRQHWEAVLTTLLQSTTPA